MNGLKWKEPLCVIYGDQSIDWPTKIESTQWERFGFSKCGPTHDFNLDAASYYHVDAAMLHGTSALIMKQDESFTIHSKYKVNSSVTCKEN